MVCNCRRLFVFYISFKWFLPTKAVVYFLIASIAYIIILYEFDVPCYWYAGSLGMGIGMLWRLFEMRIRKILSSGKISVFLFFWAVVLWVIFSRYIRFKGLHLLSSCTMFIIFVHRVMIPCSEIFVNFLSKKSSNCICFKLLL